MRMMSRLVCTIIMILMVLCMCGCEEPSDRKKVKNM